MELKIRAWDKLNKRWIPIWKLAMDGFGGVAAVIELDASSDPPWYGPWQFELSQYTGLKDNGGNDIYEGDLLERLYPTSPYGHHMPRNLGVAAYIVEWDRDRAAFALRPNYLNADGKNPPLQEITPGISSGDERFRVIGNRFENPELLNEVL